ncbi:MAG: formylmethanofuran dehydrogenase subunit C, partial [Pseudolabrys sp.]
ESDIAAIPLHTTRKPSHVGDVFKLRMGDPAQILFAGGSERFDGVGCAMTSGEIHVEGDAGIQAGRLMRGGKLAIDGNAGPWAGSGMKGGALEIAGNAGERLGGPLAGEMAGMRGGVVVVRGDAGARAGDRLRRGTIIVEGKAGSHAGSRMIAGTLIVRGRAGPLPGYLMARGTIVIAEGCDSLSPTFADCGAHDLVATALLADFVKPYSAGTAALLRRPWRRLLGDMAVIGKGEIFYPPA